LDVAFVTRPSGSSPSPILDAEVAEHLLRELHRRATEAADE
jgi:hypothetical protein